MTPASVSWEDDEVAAAWIEANRAGDAWRRQLIKPLVTRMCAELVAGRDPFGFSVFEALEGACLARGNGRAPPPIEGSVRLVDIGAGEGWLGDALGPHVEYVALEGSKLLLERARWRAQSHGGSVYQINVANPLEKDQPTLEEVLRERPKPTLVTGISLLERIERAEGFLSFLAEQLRQHATDVPVLVVTLDAEHFDDDARNKADLYGSYEARSRSPTCAC